MTRQAVKSPPELPRIGFYGDDFTGTTDAMEALSLAGLATRMFLRPPDRVIAEALQAFGVAGSARAMTPAEMDRLLLPVLAAISGALPDIGGLLHYKLCSTFDSAPSIGSIGHAIELACRVRPTPAVPLVVGAPPLGRYCCFGNLFARSGGDSDVFRLDRHPTMSRHPVTPMDEADLRLHLARQTSLPIHLIDFRHLDRADAPNPLLAATSGPPRIVLFDVLTDAHLARIGRYLAEAAAVRTLIAFGSSGVEYALAAYGRVAGLLSPQPPPAAPPPAAEVPALVTVSGSCSPVTDRQIATAVAAGHVEFPLSPEHLFGPPDGLADAAAKHVAAGRSVILHTARGPDDPRIPAVRARLAELGGRPGEALGRRLGRILARILHQTGAPRAAVTGGDTSFFVAEELGIAALDMLTPVAPGSPLCRVRGSGLLSDRTEIIFKGGQVGRDDFFETVRRGGRT